MQRPLDDGWTVKDILAHVAMWDEADVADVRRAVRGHKTSWGHWSPLIDQWNDVQFALRKDFPFDQVLTELMEARQALLECLESVPQELLITGFIPTACAVQARHDRDHAAQIQEWRKKERI